MKSIKRILAALLCLVLLPLNPVLGEEQALPILQTELVPPAEEAAVSEEFPQELPIEGEDSDVPTASEEEMIPTAAPEAAETTAPSPTASPEMEQEGELQTLTMQQVASELLSQEDANPGETAEFEIEGNTLLAYRGSDEDVVVPDGIEIIAAQAFQGCAQLKSVVLPENVHTIESLAFSGCTALAQINLPAALSSVGDDVFSGCELLNASVPYGSFAADYCTHNSILHTYSDLPESIAFTQSSLTIGTGDTYDLKTLLEVLPAGCADEITFSSTKPACVSITRDGVIKGLKVGISYITAITVNGLNAYLKVLVFRISPAWTFAFSPASLTLGEGMQGKLSLNFTSGYYGLYTLTSSDDSVATVDQNGNVRANGAGTATITASLVQYPSICKTTCVTVKGVPESIEASTQSLTLATGQTSKALQGVNPDPTNTYCGFLYESSDDTVVSVNPSTGELTANGVGRATITITADNNSAATAQCAVTVIGLSAAQINIGLGDSYDLSQIIHHPDGPGAGDFTYTSGNWRYVLADASGVVTGTRFGAAYVNIRSADGLNANVLVVCWNYATANRVALSPAELTLGVGETGTIQPKFTSGYYGLYNLSSSDETVATVDPDGTVHAHAKGEATITLSLQKYPAIQKTAKVRVMGAPDAIEASVSELILGVDQVTSVLYGVNPNPSFTRCDYIYASSDEAVASVNPATGEITAKSVGEAEITITASNNPAATASCVVIVKEAPESVSLTSDSLTIGRGDSCDISGLVSLPEGTAAGLTYSSNFPTYVSVDSNGVIRGLKNGAVYITVTTHNGHSARMIVYVKTLPTANRIVLNPATLELGEQDSGKLNVIFASGYYGLYNLSSSDESVATVDPDGTVHTHAKGEATITLSLQKYPSIQKKAKVRVMGVPDVIEASVNELVLGVDQVSSVLYGVNPNPSFTRCDYIYASSDETVASVNPATGEITAKSVGEATITITASNNPAATAACTVIVKEAPESLSLSTDSLTIGRGDSCDISALVSLAEGTAAGLTYSSNFPAYVSVDSNGVIRGLKNGAVYITVTTHNGHSTRMIVYVKTLPTANRIVLNPATLELGEQDSGKLNVIFASGYYGLYNLSSSDESVATVDPDGTVHAHAKGEATITLSLQKYPAIQKTAKVRVMGVPDAIEASVSELILGVDQVTSALHGVNPNPSFTRCDYIYVSSDETVASVNSATGEITAKSVGETTITISASNNPAATASCTVTVKEAPEGISFDAARASIGVKEQVRLNYTLLPEGAAGGVSFKSSNPAVASISADGVITGKKIGWAWITVTAYNQVQGKMALLVTYAPGSISLTADRSILGVGEEMKFATAIPAKTAGGYSFASSDEGVLAIDPASGQAKAVGQGTAKVTATTYNGAKASCEITVIDAPREILLSHTQAVIGQGDALSLRAQINEGSAGTYRLWSNKPEIASIDDSGRITAHAEGAAEIVAEAYNGVSACLNLQVVAPPEEIAVSGLPANADGAYLLELKKDQSYALEIEAGACTDVSCGFASETGAVSVSDDGVITPLRSGSDTITITSYNGKTAQVLVTVLGFASTYPGMQSIMHAMGEIDGKNYTNSREAFLENYARGHRYFEVDLSYTSDGELVLWHGWRTSKINSNCVAGYVPTLKQFENALVFDAYDSLTYRDLLLLMDAYPDTYFFMDTKETASAKVTRQYAQMVSIAREMGLEHVLDRMVVMIYNVAMLPIVRKAYPFKNYVLMCYKLFNKTPTAAQVLSAMKYCQLNDIEIISMWDHWWKPDYMAWAEEYGLTVNLHTVNSLEKAQEYLQQGVALITTDTLDAQIIAQ